MYRFILIFIFIWCKELLINGLFKKFFFWTKKNYYLSLSFNSLLASYLYFDKRFDIDNLKKGSDIALVELKTEVNIASNTQSIHPICLPNRKEKHVNDNAVIIGWGRTSENASRNYFFIYGNILKEIQRDLI